MNMEIYSFINTLVTIVLGGGWFIYYRANKRKANGEATQAEADGWKKQQEVYQTTIENQRTYYDRLKDDFNVVVEENSKLRQQNNALREKINNMEAQMFELKKEISRLGRRVEAISEKSKKTRE